MQETAWAMQLTSVLMLPHSLHYFNPRTTCVMRRHHKIRKNRHYLFQSTHRVSDATTVNGLKGNTRRFQSTHRVSDATRFAVVFIKKYIHFNPRTAWAMRRIPRSYVSSEILFQSTHRVSDATNKRLCEKPIIDYFNPRTAWAMRQRSQLIFSA